MRHVAETAPVRREVPLVLAALLPDDLEQGLADRLELAVAAVDDPEPPLETELETHVHELEEIQVRLRVLREPRQELEELLAAPGLAVEERQESPLRPRTRCAEWRAGGSLVDQRAERVAGRDDLLGRDARRSRLRLELPHALSEAVSQCGRVRMLDRRPKLRQYVEQPIGRRDQRVQPAADGGRVADLGVLDRARWLLGRRGRRSTTWRRSPAGNRHDDRAVDAEIRKRIVRHRAPPRTRARAPGTRRRCAWPGPGTARSLSRDRHRGPARSRGIPRGRGSGAAPPASCAAQSPAG